MPLRQGLCCGTQKKQGTSLWPNRRLGHKINNPNRNKHKELPVSPQRCHFVTLGYPAVYPGCFFGFRVKWFKSGIQYLTQSLLNISQYFRTKKHPKISNLTLKTRSKTFHQNTLKPSGPILDKIAPSNFNSEFTSKEVIGVPKGKDLLPTSNHHFSGAILKFTGVCFKMFSSKTKQTTIQLVHLLSFLQVSNEFCFELNPECAKSRGRISRSKDMSLWRVNFNKGVNNTLPVIPWMYLLRGC